MVAVSIAVSIATSRCRLAGLNHPEVEYRLIKSKSTVETGYRQIMEGAQASRDRPTRTLDLSGDAFRAMHRTPFNGNI